MVRSKIKKHLLEAYNVPWMAKLKEHENHDHIWRKLLVKLVYVSMFLDFDFLLEIIYIFMFLGFGLSFRN